MKSDEMMFSDNTPPLLTDAELGAMLKGTLNSRYSKIKRWVAQGKLLHIRRGLYYLTKRFGALKVPHPFQLAQYIYGPSYVSLESALSFHGLIPESVMTITSVTSKRSKVFNTPLGVFDYQHLPAENLYLGVERFEKNGYQFYIATPWKAICDYVYCYKKDWVSVKPLINSLRIPIESLPILSDTEIASMNDYYHHKRIKRFLKNVKTDLSILNEMIE